MEKLLEAGLQSTLQQDTGDCVAVLDADALQQG